MASPNTTTVVIRWILSPLAFLAFGLAAGFASFLLVMAERGVGSNVAIPLAACSALVAYLGTPVLLRAERQRTTRFTDHPRHMWMLYPFWLLSSVGASGGHVSLLYLFPAAALTGVMLGNAIAILHGTRRSNRSA